MGYLLYLIPVLILVFEHTALSSALAYARYGLEYQPPSVDLLGGLIGIGDTIPYDAVPNFVVTLHLLGLFLGLVWLGYAIFFGWNRNRNQLYPYGEE